MCAKYPPHTDGSPGRAVECDDAAGEVAPLRALPPGLGDRVGEGRLVRPGPDRLGQVDVGVWTRGDRAGDRRQRTHQVLDVGDPEGVPGGVAELADDEPAAGPGHSAHLAQAGERVDDVA